MVLAKVTIIYLPQNNFTAAGAHSYYLHPQYWIMLCVIKGNEVFFRLSAGKICAQAQTVQFWWAFCHHRVFARSLKPAP
jgi:hypothetical protein